MFVLHLLKLQWRFEFSKMWMLSFCVIFPPTMYAINAGFRFNHQSSSFQRPYLLQSVEKFLLQIRAHKPATEFCLLLRWEESNRTKKKTPCIIMGCCRSEVVANHSPVCYQCVAVLEGFFAQTIIAVFHPSGSWCRRSDGRASVLENTWSEVTG